MGLGGTWEGLSAPTLLLRWTEGWGCGEGWGVGAEVGGLGRSSAWLESPTERAKRWLRDCLRGQRCDQTN